MAVQFLKDGGVFNAADNRCTFSNGNSQKQSPFQPKKKLGGNKKGFTPNHLMLILAVLASASIPLTNASPAPERSLITGITTQGDLQTAISAWCYNSTAANSTYGPISQWDISTVTSMKWLFSSHCSSLATFNEPLESWDVSSVTDMLDALKGESSFNQPLAM